MKKWALKPFASISPSSLVIQCPRICFLPLPQSSRGERSSTIWGAFTRETSSRRNPFPESMVQYSEASKHVAAPKNQLWFPELMKQLVAQPMGILIEERPPIPSVGHNMAPQSRAGEPICVASQWSPLVMRDLRQRVLNTITEAWAVRLGAYKPISEECLRTGVKCEIMTCPVLVLLAFLHEGLDDRWTQTTLKV